MLVGRIKNTEGITCITIGCSENEFLFLKKFVEASLAMFKNIRSNAVVRMALERQERQAGRKGGFVEMLSVAEKISNDLNGPITDL